MLFWVVAGTQSARTEPVGTWASTLGVEATVPGSDEGRNTERTVECEMEFEARTYDVDFAGIVSNIVYHRWMEDLRLAVLAQTAPVTALLEAGLVPTLVQTLVDFRAPLRLGERARGRQAVTSVGTTSFVFETELRRVPDGQVVAVARHTVVLVDLETGRPRPAPEAVRRLLVKPSFTVQLRGIDEVASPSGRTSP